MGNTSTNPVAPETTLLRKNQVCGYEGRCLREINRRLKPGHPNFLVSWKSEDRTVWIDPGSMTPHGKDNWRQDLLRNAVKITVEPAEPGLLAHEQGSFFPEIERDKGSAACIASAWDQQEALRRLRILQPAENHDYGALGYPTKGAFRKAIKKETSVS